MIALRLALLVSSTLLGSLLSALAFVAPAHAQLSTPIPVPSPETAECVANPHQKFQLVCNRLGAQETTVQASRENGSLPPPVLEFTEEESNTAIALFGCDCPLCLNALRQMRGQPPLNQLG